MAGSTTATTTIRHPATTHIIGVDPIITELWKADFAEMYFLCSPDIPWIYDPQRENPHDRDRLFDIHQTILKENNLPFQIISGDFENRISHVTQIINRMN